MVIGDLVQQGVTQSDYSMTGAITVVATLALLTVAMSYVSFRFPRLRPVLEGEPLVLVEDGRPIERNLRRERITVDELRAAAREQQLASLDRVHLAILETSGRISFIPLRRLIAAACERSILKDADSADACGALGLLMRLQLVPVRPSRDLTPRGEPERRDLVA